MEGTENAKETKSENGIEENVIGTFEKMNDIVENTNIVETITDEKPLTENNIDDQSNVGQSEQPIVEDLEKQEDIQPVIETISEPVAEVIAEPVVEKTEEIIAEPIVSPVVETITEEPIVEEKPKVDEPIIEGNDGSEIKSEQLTDTVIEPANSGDEQKDKENIGNGETVGNGSEEQPTITTETPTEGENETDKITAPPTETTTPPETTTTNTGDVESEAYEEVVALIHAEHLFSYDVIGKHLKNGINIDSLKTFHVDFVKAGICSKPEHYKILELLTKLFGAV